MENSDRDISTNNYYANVKYLADGNLEADATILSRLLSNAPSNQPYGPRCQTIAHYHHRSGVVYDFGFNAYYTTVDPSHPPTQAIPECEEIYPAQYLQTISDIRNYRQQQGHHLPCNYLQQFQGPAHQPHHAFSPTRHDQQGPEVLLQRPEEKLQKFMPRKLTGIYPGPIRGNKNLSVQRQEEPQSFPAQMLPMYLSKR